MAQLAHELVEDGAARAPTATALRHGTVRISYASLAAGATAFGAALRACGCVGDERIAIRLPASQQAVLALLGASAAGCAFVLLDPALDTTRCAALLRDCGAHVLVTGAGDVATLALLSRACPSLRTVVVHGPAENAAEVPGCRTLAWDRFMTLASAPGAPPACSSLVALVYGEREDGCSEPRGMAMSHRNLVAGAAATASCLGMAPGDRVFCTLGLYTDYGLNALLASFAAGASAVFEDGDPASAVRRLLARGELTGLIIGPTAGPALPRAMASAPLRDPAGCLRYLAFAMGHIERTALAALCDTLPLNRIHLLHDIGDAARATSLLLAEAAAHPGAIGRALPYSDWLVLRPDGRECGPGEPGELVRRGALVPLGYWNDARTTAQRFRPLPAPAGLPGLSGRETGFASGVFARRDRDGFLYPVEARLDAILTNGYRVSPRDVEKIVVGTGLVAEAAAIGVARPLLGQVIAVLATPRHGARLDSTILLGACRARLPEHMLPTMVDVRRSPLPRARDGEIDRALLAGELAPLFAESGTGARAGVAP